MGVAENISHSSFPKQGSLLGKSVNVCFHYKTSHTIRGVCVRDDVEAPFESIFRLDDGRSVRSVECQFSIAEPNEQPEKKAERADEYCYSWNGEGFKSDTFYSVKDALAAAAADNEEDNAHVHIGKVDRPSNSQFFPDAGDVIEHMENQASDYGGEYAEYYPDVSEEAKAELGDQLAALLDAWCERHDVSPNFYQVVAVKEYPVSSSPSQEG